MADRAEQEAAQLMPSPQSTFTMDRSARQQGADTVSLLKLIVVSLMFKLNDLYSVIRIEDRRCITFA